MYLSSRLGCLTSSFMFILCCMLQSDDLQDPHRIRTSGRLLMGRAIVNSLEQRIFPEGLPGDPVQGPSPGRLNYWLWYDGLTGRCGER
jgi:hypothetical protein